MLPFVPISEELLDPEWIREDYEVLKSALDRPIPRIAEGWRGFIYMVRRGCTFWSSLEFLTILRRLALYSMLKRAGRTLFL
jgi:endoglucanase Acf2